MSLNDVYADAKERMDKSFDHLQQELAKIRTGRATPALLDTVRVDYYGTPTPLNQVASVTAPEARLLVVQPWEKRLIPDIEKAIQTADLGLNPSNDGNVVRVPIPELSNERRQDLVKLVKKNCEDARIATRNIRRDANDVIKKMEKNHEISEDNSHDGHDKVQEITNNHIKKIDELLSRKETEILGD